jgi:hypothetical protein
MSYATDKRISKYESLSKIFRIDTVKIIKLTVRPINCHQPRSNSPPPHVDTRPTSPPFLERFLEVLSRQSVNHSLRFGLGSIQWYQTGVLSVSFFEIGRSHRVPNQGSTVGGDDIRFVFRQKILGEDGSVRRGFVMVKQPGLFSPNFGATFSHVFTRFHAVAAKLRSRTWNSECGRLGQILCATTTAVKMTAQVRNILNVTS